VFVGRQELEDAFSMLDLDKSGYISVSNLKKRLGVFFPDLYVRHECTCVRKSVYGGWVFI